VGDRADHVSARTGLHAALLAWPSERLSARRRPLGPRRDRAPRSRPTRS
jgi:hypothetical protein